MHRTLHQRDYIDSMCPEKKEEEDSSALKIVSLQEFKDSKNIQKNSKEKLITAAINSNNIRINSRINRKITYEN